MIIPSNHDIYRNARSLKNDVTLVMWGRSVIWTTCCGKSVTSYYLLDKHNVECTFADVVTVD